ncbi:MAG: methyltransferase domain-containing protein [Flavobacteriales bacterium]|nr:methyltransferase domain-containing protein [Flavobacteriales bacterium]
MDPTQQAVRIFGEHAESYAQKYADVGRYAPSLDRFLSLIPHGGHVLELACGPGNVTRYLLDRRPDLQVVATDLAPEMLAVAERTVPEAEHQLMDMRAVGSAQRQYQGVVCAFGLPYLDQRAAAQFIGGAAARLLPGGALYLSTMEDDPAKSGWEGPSADHPIFMNYHLAKDLEAALRSAGLVLVLEERVSYVSTHGSNVTDLLIVAHRP